MHDCLCFVEFLCFPIWLIDTEHGAKLILEAYHRSSRGDYLAGEKDQYHHEFHTGLDY